MKLVLPAFVMCGCWNFSMICFTTDDRLVAVEAVELEVVDAVELEAVDAVD
jgi:hypothetical protein